MRIKIDDFNPCNYLIYFWPFDRVAQKFISKKRRRMLLYDGLIRRAEGKIWGLEIGQDVSWQEISEFRKRKEEMISRANELDKAVKEKMKLPKVNMDEIKGEVQDVERLKAEAGLIERMKEHYDDKGAALFFTIPQLIDGQERDIKDRLEEITRTQKSVQYYKEKRNSL